ncbi:hypothetical protein QTP70_004615, partial [Hemibagrus guttatus]
GERRLLEKGLTFVPTP